MSLRMQLRRGIIALIIVLALFGFALSRAGFGAGGHGHGFGVAAPATAGDRRQCDTLLSIDLAGAVRVRVACDTACVPVDRLLTALRVPVARRSTCAELLSA